MTKHVDFFTMFLQIAAFAAKFIFTNGENMEFSNYFEFVKHLKQIPTQKQQLNEIIRYCTNNVQVDYVMIEHINEIVTLKFTKYVDTLFPNINETLQKKAISFLRNSTNISNTYWERIKSIYTEPSIDDNGNPVYSSLTDALLSISTDHRAINGLLTKGTSEHISTFVKHICDDIGIKCIIVKGVSSGRMQHFWLNICIDNEELFYDIAYALYVRDNFCEIGKQYLPEEWLGITPKQLYKNQPTRTIVSPSGFDLKFLGLNNARLCMKDFFDKGA